ncbi:inositol monophosphatase family protein [Coralliovum pocilloporae]|uniref:inositol monophosphatase family protein n=1 Tax=Coralliovum pocilloporae TaxID=3066369 RepID=UPI0033077D74
MAYSAIMNVMVNAVMKAGRSLKRDFAEAESLLVSRKGPGDFVSAADKKSEKILYEELSKARPTYGFLMEEGGEIIGEDPTCRWIIDPLDGTTNFLHGIPAFAISVAVERQGRLDAAVIFNPATDDLYTAERGSGAFMNDRRMRVSGRVDLHDSVIATGIPHLGRGQHSLALRELKHVMSEVSGIRRFGAASLDLAWVAAGRFDAFWERDLNAWDMAAGILLIKEAGGFVSDVNNRDKIFESGSIVAGNETMHRNLVALLKRAKTPPRS